LAKPAADCQNRPAATTRKAPGANGCRLRPAALRGRLATGWQPAADWQSACRQHLSPPKEVPALFAACRFAGHGRKPRLKLLPNTRRIRRRQHPYVRGEVCPGEVFIAFGGPQGHDDRMASCGRLAIGLLVARATLEKRLRSLRLAALRRRLASCAAVANRRCHCI